MCSIITGDPDPSPFYIQSTIAAQGINVPKRIQHTSPYMLNLGSLAHPHGLEEAHVVHRPDPGHLGQVGEAGRTHLMLTHVQ